jgi:hypothetical protein
MREENVAVAAFRSRAATSKGARVPAADAPDSAVQFA